jgi:hypothetical protein
MAKDTTIPSFLIPQDGVVMNFSVTGTDALIEDQGYTYNQAGFTYNQTGVAYGGVYNTNEDILPMTLSAQAIEPMNLFAHDIYSLPPVPNNQRTVGPGWFMYVSQ